MKRIGSNITAALPTALAGLNLDEVADKTANLDAVAPLLRQMLAALGVTMPEQRPTLTVEVFHEFELDGEAYDVAKVTWTGKRPTLEEAIKAADTDSRPVVRTDEEWQRVYRSRQQLPEKLNGRWLITARPSPAYPRDFSRLDRDGGEWYGRWDYLLGGGLSAYVLVLRRRT